MSNVVWMKRAKETRSVAVKLLIVFCAISAFAGFGIYFIIAFADAIDGKAHQRIPDKMPVWVAESVKYQAVQQLTGGVN